MFRSTGFIIGGKPEEGGNSLDEVATYSFEDYTKDTVMMNHSLARGNLGLLSSWLDWCFLLGCTTFKYTVLKLIFECFILNATFLNRLIASFWVTERNVLFYILFAYCPR